MEAVADLLRDDDTPPPSGVRLRAPAIRLPPLPAPPQASPDVLAEVAEEVFFEVWDVVRALSPLQGAWLHLGLRQLGGALRTVITWRCHPGARPTTVLRRRWPELVPGHAAMDRLAHLMVDRVCG